MADAAAAGGAAAPQPFARRLLHTMLRVGDLERSKAFYCGLLGMRVLRFTDRPEQQYSLTFVGYGDEASSTVLELTYNYGVTKYEVGTAFGHLALAVASAAATCAEAAAQGFTVSRPAGPVKGGKTVIAFLTDPVRPCWARGATRPADLTSLPPSPPSLPPQLPGRLQGGAD